MLITYFEKYELFLSSKRSQTSNVNTEGFSKYNKNLNLEISDKRITHEYQKGLSLHYMQNKPNAEAIFLLFKGWAG